ncbi:MAG: pentapeptide repeat-containing protein, partial [Caldilineaceae bacterium]|nr:pentapeptide repeat-containing protein [Caldilineaceae bacterium]
MKILEMLQAGTIGVDEATRLLEAVDGASKQEADVVTVAPAHKDIGAPEKKIKIKLNLPLEMVKRTHFTGAQLDGVNFEGASLEDANFRDADLTHAVFTNRFGLINSVAINPTQTLIAAGTGTGEIRIWHYANRQLAVSIPGQQKPVWAVLFSPDGQLLASSDDQTVQLWQIEVSGEQVMLNNRRTLVGHTSDVHALAFDPTGKTMASAG